jgi:hypothetical protein
MGHWIQLPANNKILSSILEYVDRLERHGNHPIQLLCFRPLWSWCAEALDLAEVCSPLVLQRDALYLLTYNYRYNTFLILYPIGVASETYLIFKAIGPAERLNEYYGYALYGILATYVPGFYTLFTHMLKQRRRILSSKTK